MKILVINCGSSSLKYQLIDMASEKVMAKGTFERIGQPNSFLTHKVNGEKYRLEKPVCNHEEALEFSLEQLLNPEYKVIDSLEEINATGHRIVHGGEKFNKPVIVTEEVISSLFKRMSRSTISRLIRGSTLPVGSSAIMRSALFARARARATRCCSPPESSVG